MNKFLFFLLITVHCFSQNKYDHYFFRPEIMVGKTIPSYKLFTGKNAQTVIGLSYAHKNYKPEIEWQRILNYPTTGVSFYITHFGAKEKGNAYAIIPFIEFYWNKKKKWSTKLGMGSSYFDTKYHPINNPTNKAISTSFTWAIQGFIYYDLALNKRNIKLGLGVFHYSNGHLKIPNNGFNSALLSVSSKFHRKQKGIFETEKEFDITSVKKISNAYYAIRYGNGIHAFVTEDSPLKNTSTIAFSGGVFYKNIVRLNTGINYRYYQHYYDYITENNPEYYSENPFKNALNIYVSIGAEMLLGQIGLDWEGGLNIYKPFYKKHYELQGIRTGGKFKGKLKQLFLGRLGLKLYAINTRKKTKNNFYIGAHINSNLSQADFSELSIGFVHRLKQKI